MGSRRPSRCLGRREFLKSLGTKDAREAKRRFPDAKAECEALFARARLSAAAVDELDDAQIKQIADAWLSRALEEEDELRQVHREEVDLPFDPADHRHGLAEVGLRMPGIVLLSPTNRSSFGRAGERLRR